MCGGACGGTVVVYCHSNVQFMARFLFRAQDLNMTNGDYAFFTFRALRYGAPVQPWNKDSKDKDKDVLSRRRSAYQAVKYVRIYRKRISIS